MTPEQSAEVVGQELAGYASELVPGAVEHLSKLWSPLAAMPPEARAAEVAKRFASGMADRWRDPAHEPSKVHPVAAAVARQSGHLQEGAVATLTDRLSVKLAGIADPGRLAGAVAREIRSPANAHLLRNPPPVAAYVARLDTMLADHFGDVLTPSGRAGLIADRGRELQAMKEGQLILAVAGVLSLPLNAAKYGTGRTIQADDPRRQGANISGVTRTVTPPPTRDAGGRYTPGQASTPGQPARRRLSL